MVLNCARTHAGVELAVLRDGPIFLELGLPPTFAERRQRAHHRLPLGDREAGFGEPGGAADQNHRQNQRGDGVEPQPDGAGVKFACCRHHRSLLGGARGPYRATACACNRVIARSEATKQSRMSQREAGLLRFARNDDSWYRRRHAASPAQIHRRHRAVRAGHRLGARSPWRWRSFPPSATTRSPRRFTT